MTIERDWVSADYNYKLTCNIKYMHVHKTYNYSDSTLQVV